MTAPGGGGAGDPEALMATATVLFAAGRIEEAVRLARASLRAAPGWGDGWARFAAALEAADRPRDALAACRESLRLGGPRPEMLALGLRLARRLERRAQAVDFAAALAEAMPEAWAGAFNLALALADHRRLDEALAAARRAAALGGDTETVARLVSDVGVLLKAEGRTTAAVAAFREALALAPDAADVHSNLLLTLCYAPDVDPRDLLDAHRAYGDRFSRPFDPLAFPNDPDPDRRLRLGYVSPDFRRHVVAQMTAGVIAAHDRTRFEVFCYAEVPEPDAVTATIRAAADHWRSTVGLSDAAVAAMIRADRIDVLVDLAGHTGGNRLPVFGLKPAPVQASWLGYPTTTGMPAIDHLVASVPPAFAVETPLPAPPPLYVPRETPPLPSPPPRLARGWPTFGCFNNASKLNGEVITLWAAILRAVPDARLILKAVGFGATGGGEAIRTAFATEGIAADRLELRGPSRYRDFMAETADIDVALDPFPYGGANTTFDMLHMGVPVVALASHDARMAAPWILHSVGLRETVAKTPEDYVAIAVELAADTERLVGLRRTLRNRLARTGVGDARRLTTEIEAVWREAWTRWARRRRAADDQGAGK